MKHSVWARGIALAMALALVVLSLPTAAFAAGNVTYLDSDGNTRVQANYTMVNSNTTNLTAGWYVVEGDVAIAERITVAGDVHLILKDNATLTIDGGISVVEGNSFALYAQSEQDTLMGRLMINTAQQCAGIGGDEDNNAGTITINGGYVDIDNVGSVCTSIGAGYFGSSGTITVNGGYLMLDRGGHGFVNGADAIGGGIGVSDNSICDVVLNGGTIFVRGGQMGHGTPIRGRLITGQQGDVVLYAYQGVYMGNPIATDTSMQDEWNLLVYTWGEVITYGNVTLQQDLILPATVNNDGSGTYTNKLTVSSGSTVNIPSGVTMTIGQDTQLTNNGTISVQSGGTLDIIDAKEINGSGRVDKQPGSIIVASQKSENRFSVERITDTTIQVFGMAFEAMYMCTTDKTTPDYDDEGWVLGDFILAQFTGLRPGTAYYVWTYTPGGDYMLDSPITGGETPVYTAPQISVTGDTQSHLQQDTVQIDITAQDDAPVQVEVKEGDGEWTDITQTYREGYTVSQNGTYQFRAYIGQSEKMTAAITYTKLDSQQPVAVIDTNGYQGGWTNQAVQLQITNGNTQNIGECTVQMRTDTTDWQTCQDTLVFDTEVNTTYYFRVVSASGVASQPVAVDIKIDKTAPSAGVTVNGQGATCTIDQVLFDCYLAADGKIQIDGQDTDSGAQKVDYYLCNTVLTLQQLQGIDSWQTYTGTITLPAQNGEQWVCYVKVTDGAGNVAYAAGNGIVFDTQAPVVNGVVDGGVYYTTQLVTVQDQNITQITLNGQQVDADIVLAGNVQASYTIVATDRANNSTTLQITMRPIGDILGDLANLTTDTVTYDSYQALSDAKATLDQLQNSTTATPQELQQVQQDAQLAQQLLQKIQQIKQQIETLSQEAYGYTQGTVTSASRPALESLLQTAQELLSTQNITDSQTQQLQQIQQHLQGLLNTLDQAAQAGNSAVIDKVEGITPDNVTPEDGEDLQQAKDQLETALKEYQDNYTPQEKQDLLQKLEEVQQALDALTQVQQVIDAIKALPDTVQPDQLDVVEQVFDTNSAYNQLTNHQKQLVGQQMTDKLLGLVAACTDYRVTAGNTDWDPQSGKGLTVTANGALQKFVQLLVDGQVVDSSNYTAVSGSTIVTLTPQYLKTLKAGQHTITFVYTDGQASSSFTVLPLQDSNAPATGDNTPVWPVWLALGAVCALVLSRRQGAKANK